MADSTSSSSGQTASSSTAVSSSYESGTVGYSVSAELVDGKPKVSYVSTSRCRAVLDGSKLIVQLSPFDRLMVDTPNKVIFSTRTIKIEHLNTNGQVMVTPIYPCADTTSTSSSSTARSSSSASSSSTSPRASSISSTSAAAPSTSANAIPDILSSQASPLSTVVYEVPPPLVVLDTCTIGYRYYPINLQEYGTIYTKDGASLVLLITGNLPQAPSAAGDAAGGGAAGLLGGLRGAGGGEGGGAARGTTSGSGEMKRSKIRSRALPYRSCNKFEASRTVGEKSTAMVSQLLQSVARIVDGGKEPTVEELIDSGDSSSSSSTLRKRIGVKTDHNKENDTEPLLDASKNNIKEETGTKGDSSDPSKVLVVPTGNSLCDAPQEVPASSCVGECIYLRCDESLVRYRLRSSADRVELHSGKLIAWTLGVKFEYKSFCCSKTTIAVSGQPSGTVWIHNP
eukprot:GHVQ01015551.1.p1 GENE.GHVQ01015551.1~~GHVQ01015551.1.p1  ORF type:complete len:454 (-),score=85.87 GHVQ01015551.1:367-1728(-)